MIETGLAGKVVVVTGGAAGIGRSTALRFAAEGCRVAAWDVSGADGEAGEALASELEAAGAGGALVSSVDVTDAAAVEAGVAAVEEAWGGLRVLVNNAGITRDAQLIKWRRGELLGSLGEDAFDSVLDVNLKGIFLCTRAAAPAMIRSGGGVVLCASSVVAASGNFGQTNYAAAKAGTIAMARTWARELGRHGIRVNVVAPGFVETAMVRKMPPPLREQVVGHVPLGRLGTPEEVAEAYLWLASDAASFVHGAVLGVDGGLVVGS